MCTYQSVQSNNIYTEKGVGQKVSKKNEYLAIAGGVAAMSKKGRVRKKGWVRKSTEDEYLWTMST